MSITDNLENILKTHKETVLQLEKELKVLSNNDLTKENTLLKKENAVLKEENEKIKLELKAAQEENARIKNALYEQIYSEKLKILNLSARKLDIYFRTNRDQGINKLNQFERDIRLRIDQINRELQKKQIDLRDEIYDQLNNLSVALDEKIRQIKLKYSKDNEVLSKNAKQEFEALKNEQITEEEINAITKKNNIEAFIGQNLINKIGIFLIVIGVIAASQYTYTRLNDIMKGISMFVLGSIMLVIGEILNRKKPSVFSLGVASGGIAILYVATSISYFGLKILPMYPALVICLLITAVSFLLSLRYNSQTIAAFALIGGYLPIFSISSNLIMIYGAMVYFMVLNLFALGISFKKKWQISSFIGLILNIFGTVYIVNSTIYRIEKLPFGINHIVLIAYIASAFLNYTAIPVISTYKTSKRFKKADVVLLGINTFISSIIMYSTFYRLELDKFTGLLSFLFAVVYLFMWKIVEIKFDGEKHAAALFYLTGLTFTVLVVPFQFGKAWVSLGWLVEGVLLTTYGILKREKRFRRSGFAINYICLASFILLDLLLQVDDLFAYKYLAITLGSLIILGAYMYRNEPFGIFEKAYKYAAVVNLWLYAIYNHVKISDLFDKILPNTLRISDGLNFTILIAETFLIAYGILRIKRLADTGTKVISYLLYFIGVMMTITFNSDYMFTYSGEGDISLIMVGIGTLILILANLLAVFAVNDLIKGIVTEGKLKIEWYPLLISAFFVILLTQNLTVQLGLEFSNMAFSIIYAVTAFLWIVFGFVKRYTLIRRFGLGLAILSVVKLFLIDLSYLTVGYKIVAYFALGISLVAISFVYQHFIKKLENIDSVKNYNESSADNL